jgi:hypothetical protein
MTTQQTQMAFIEFDDHLWPVEVLSGVLGYRECLGCEDKETAMHHQNKVAE